MIFRLCSMINKCVSQLVGLPEWQLRREHKVDAAKSWMVHMHGDVFVPLIFERLYEEEVTDLVMSEDPSSDCLVICIDRVLRPDHLVSCQSLERFEELVAVQGEFITQQSFVDTL